jgi:hypothetical protein
MKFGSLMWLFFFQSSIIEANPEEISRWKMRRQKKGMEEIFENR